MNKTKFEAYHMSIDYSLLGTFPSNIDTVKSDEALFTLFMECFKLTFSNTVFTYYGDLEECRAQLENSLLLDELNFKERTNRQKWQILLLVVIDMFFKMHNTYLAQETIEEVCNNFDLFTEEELTRVIHDLNFALFFGIEECVVVSPSKIKDLNASDEDTVLLGELLSCQKDLISIIKNNIKRRDVVKDNFEKLFKAPLSNDYTVHLFDGFISAWIEMMEYSDEIDETEWENISTEVYAIIQTFFSLTIQTDIALVSVTEEMYYYIINLYKNTFKIKYPIYSVPE